MEGKERRKAKKQGERGQMIKILGIMNFFYEQMEKKFKWTQWFSI